MDSQPSPFLPFADPLSTDRSTPAAISAAGAISYALEDTLRFLFRPFDAWRWTKLGLLCLFLGGGPSTAAFQWSLGALPSDFRLPDVLSHARQLVALHPSLIVLLVAFTLALGVVFLYLRSLFRFVLVDSLVRMEVRFRPAWSEVRPLGKSYFGWLVATLASLAVVFSLLVGIAFPGLRLFSASGPGKLFATAALALILSCIVLLGLAVTLLIMLTDDLVVPLMYAGRLPLPGAWRELWQIMRRDPTSFAIYILLRFLLSVGISVAVLLFLVPSLIGLLSAAIIVAATVVLALHLLGLTWAWSLSTITLAALALVLFSALLTVLLGVVGMPGQVFLQDFSLRFMAARSPALDALCSRSGNPPESDPFQQFFSF